MKAIGGLVLLWLICGMIAAYQIEATRSASWAEVLMGPISLVRVMRG
jgi:hypothetical protein